ncbi:hypothetical protein [uncultured Roseibium sp.]|uniref:hypothetical protein n=1 Tax=uncultured Roseibium sp. TaxID=1936171 RepID=UPI003217837E
MTQPEFNDQGNEEKPLDPAVERVQKKLRRLLAGSSLVMLAGFIAVFAAIFYKINSSSKQVDAASIARTIAIGANATVESVDWVDGRMMVVIRENGTTALLQVDPSTGRVLGRTDFVAQ